MTETEAREKLSKMMAKVTQQLIAGGKEDAPDSDAGMKGLFGTIPDISEEEAGEVARILSIDHCAAELEKAVLATGFYVDFRARGKRRLLQKKGEYCIDPDCQNKKHPNCHR